MLVLKIKKGQKIIIDEQLTLWVNGITRKQISVVFDAPKKVRIKKIKMEILQEHNEVKG